MHCISISYRKAPVHIRELFTFTVEEKLALEQELCTGYPASGCIVVSTCNRSEIYFAGAGELIPKVAKAAALKKHADYGELKKYFLTYSEEGTLKHLFKVTGGLDSMVLGEDEILRQMKEAYLLSLEHNHTDSEMNIAFQNAFRQAKRIKSLTGISTTPVSIATLAANKILEYGKNLPEPAVLIVGATGKMGGTVAKNLYDKGGFQITGTVRSSVGKPKGSTGNSESSVGKPEGGTENSESGMRKPEGGTKNSESGMGKPEGGTESSESGMAVGSGTAMVSGNKRMTEDGMTTASIQWISYSERYEAMKAADVIVSATTSPHYTFTGEEVARALGKEKRPKLFIDLAVPRDIDQDILTIDKLELIDIDYFEKASMENNRLRRQEADKAGLILEECVDETLKEIYFQRFQGSMEQLAQKISQQGQGLPDVLYRLKEGLDSIQLKAVLKLLEEMLS